MTTKTEAASEVRKILQSVKDRLAQPGGAKVNEATTRAYFITPLLAALGYQSIDDVLFEVYLPDGKTFLDYRLVVGTKPRVAVEAKALGVPVTDKDAAQAVQYASLLGDQWSVVTNARVWRLYETFAQVPLAEKHILTVDLVGWNSDAEFDAVFEQLWLTSRESFETDNGPASWLTSKKLDALLRNVLTDPASPEVRYIKKRLLTHDVAVTDEQVASWLRTRLDSATPTAAVVRPSWDPASTKTHQTSEPTSAPRYTSVDTTATQHWLVPAGARKGTEAIDFLKMWLGRGYWGFGERTPGRKAMRTGDHVCFYASKIHEVVAYAELAGPIDKLIEASDWPEPEPPEQPLYKMPLANIVWLPHPTTLDAAVRSTLDAYSGKNPAGNWSFLVQTTRRLSAADFARLTGT